METVCFPTLCEETFDFQRFGGNKDGCPTLHKSEPSMKVYIHFPEKSNLPIGNSVLLPWIQTSLLKNLKLFSIRVKEVFEPIVLREKTKKTKQNKNDGFLFFLKAFSWDIDLWVTLGDFTVKKREIGKRQLYLAENWLRRNEILYA